MLASPGCIRIRDTTQNVNKYVFLVNFPLTTVPHQGRIRMGGNLFAFMAEASSRPAVWLIVMSGSGSVNTYWHLIKRFSWSTIVILKSHWHFYTEDPLPNVKQPIKGHDAHLTLDCFVIMSLIRETLDCVRVSKTISGWLWLGKGKSEKKGAYVRDPLLRHLKYNLI